MAVFVGCQIVLELTMSVKLKEKTALKKSITSNGGVVSFIVTKNATHIICNDVEKAKDSYKCKMALKYGIPIVSMEFIHKCVSENRLLNTDDFLMAGKSKSEGLKEGKISASKFEKKDGQKKKTKPYVNVQGIKVWKGSDKQCPQFTEEFQIAKFATFSYMKKDKRKFQDLFTVLEIHVDDNFVADNSATTFKYRVTAHSGDLQVVEGGRQIPLECRFCNTVDEALAVYSQLYREHEQKGFTLQHGALSRHIGSRKYRLLMDELGLESGTVSEEVAELMEHIWSEAEGQIEEMLAIPIARLKMEQVEKAEAILKQLRVAIDTNDSSKVPKMMTEFYDSLPHLPAYMTMTLSKRWLSKKHGIVQLVKDILTLSEATDWFTKSSIQSKYKTLRCNIQNLSKTSQEFINMSNVVLRTTTRYSDLKIENIFAVSRPVESVNFRKSEKEEDVRMMFHASRGENMVGILSRGLLLPRVIVDDHHGERTDPGLLGSGIYFASSASTSVGYSSPSKVKGTRFMLINEVFLGRCKDLQTKDFSLTEPPEGYDSVHAVPGGDFKEDEFAVYNTNQQCLRYLVEFKLDKDTVHNVAVEIGMESLDIEEDSLDTINLTDVKDIIDPMSKVKAGLVATGDDLIELKSAHIRAKLVDLASEVVVLQEYVNNSKQHLEAKYVFPLGDMAAVCGFEAFINGKHIVGEVKEKETAHKEYKKAISEGHGAYLMDQDEETPDVFTVSVGNLPPGATVLIKITYVAELQVEGELISFTLPGSVAPWKKKSLKEVTQDKTDTVEVQQGETTVQISLNMPFDIRSLECPTNQVNVKRTSQRATIELQENQSIADGFQLLIGLAEIHVPRMWVERKPDDIDHQACMLTFFPEFEACEVDDVNIVFLLDLSNSMKGDNLMNAKKILMLTLTHMSPAWNFNIVVFGTAFKELFPTCLPKTQTNMKTATEFIKKLSASMGNTEVIRPLQSFYLLRQESSVQNILLLSDGHVNNEEVLLKQALLNCQHTRLFTMGVSSTANRHMLRALARVGAGAYEFFDAKAKSKWEGKVKSQLCKAAQPGLTSVRVDWEQHGHEGEPHVQAPKQITALFSGSRQVITGFVPNCTMATLRATIAGDEVSTVVSTSELSITSGMVLHRLTARAVIRDWEDGMLSQDRTDHEIAKMNMKDYIIQLSKDYSIVTQLTSFVAIEKRDKDEEKKAVDAPAISELVDNECVDELTYMSFEEEKKKNVDYVKAVDDMLINIRLNFDSKRKQKDFLQEAFEYLSNVEDASVLQDKTLQLEAAFDEWELDEEFDFETEFNQKRITPGKNVPQLYVKTLTGEVLTIYTSLDCTCEELKNKVQDQTGVSPAQQRLIFAGQQIEDRKKLSDYYIQNECTLHLLQRLRGGGDGIQRPPDVASCLSSRRALIDECMSADDSSSDYSDDDSEDWSESEDCEEEGRKLYSQTEGLIRESRAEPVRISREDLSSEDEESEEDEMMAFGLFSDSEAGSSMKTFAEEQIHQLQDEKLDLYVLEARERRVQLFRMVNRKKTLEGVEEEYSSIVDAYRCLERTLEEKSSVLDRVEQSPLCGSSLMLQSAPMLADMAEEEEVEEIYEEMDDMLMDDMSIIEEEEGDRRNKAYNSRDIEMDSAVSPEPAPDFIDESESPLEISEAISLAISIDSNRLSKKKKKKVPYESRFCSSFQPQSSDKELSEASPLSLGLSHDFSSLLKKKSLSFASSPSPRPMMGEVLSCDVYVPAPPLPPPPAPPSAPKPAPMVAFAAPQPLTRQAFSRPHCLFNAPPPPPTRGGAPPPSHSRGNVPPPLTSFSFGAPPPPPTLSGAPPPPPIFEGGPHPPPTFGGAPPPPPTLSCAPPPPPIFGGAPPPPPTFGGAPPPPPTLSGAPPPPPIFGSGLHSPAKKSVFSTERCASTSVPIAMFDADAPGGGGPPPPPHMGFGSTPFMGFARKPLFETSNSPPLPPRRGGAASKFNINSHAEGKIRSKEEESLESAVQHKGKTHERSLFDADDTLPKGKHVSWRRESSPVFRKTKACFTKRASEVILHESTSLEDQAPESKTPQEKKAGHVMKTLYDYGIGIQLPYVVKGEVNLLKNFERVFELQGSRGEWTMSSELGQLLGVDFDLCQEVLFKAGLKSLGIAVTDHILELVATTITLMSFLRILLPKRLPVDFSDDQSFNTLVKELKQQLSKRQNQSTKYEECYMAGLDFCRKTEEKYPLVISMLELGKDLVLFCANILRIHAPAADKYSEPDVAAYKRPRLIHV